MAAMMDWQWISMAMSASIAVITHTDSVALQVLSFVLGMWIVGVFMHRLALLGHDAGHRTICRSPWLNDALAVFFVMWPMLLSMQAWRLYHNEGHHPRPHTGTLRDPEIAFKRLEGSWALPLTPRRMRRDMLLSLFGAAAPGAMLFVASLASPRCFARFSQLVTLLLRRIKGEDAAIMPLRYRHLRNGAAAIAADALVGVALVLGRLGLTAAFTIGFTRLIGASDVWPLVLGLWYGGYATSFWTVFRLRALCEHVGGYTLSLAKPPLWQRALLFPHGAWAHELHHELPGLPFHRYEDVLRARGTLGLQVSEVYRLFTDSPQLVSGETMQPGDPRGVMARAQQASLLVTAVPAEGAAR